MVNSHRNNVWICTVHCRPWAGKQMMNSSFSKKAAWWVGGTLSCSVGSRQLLTLRIPCLRDHLPIYLLISSSQTPSFILWQEADRSDEGPGLPLNQDVSTAWSHLLHWVWGFPGGPVVKSLPCSAEVVGSISGLVRELRFHMLQGHLSPSASVKIPHVSAKTWCSQTLKRKEKATIEAINPVWSSASPCMLLGNGRLQVSGGIRHCCMAF